jgi:ADP-ribose pyrophosphatase
MSLPTWTRLASRPLADCKVFQLRADTWRSPRTGEAHDFFVLESPDWVNVLPFTDEGELILVRQHRFGVDRDSLEIPGGMVDPGESPLDAARRELLEETGYAPSRFEPLGTIESNPAILTNLTHTFLAPGCREVAAQKLDSTEELELVKVPVARIDELLQDGDIKHALVAVAFLHWKLKGSPTK